MRTTRRRDRPGRQPAIAWAWLGGLAVALGVAGCIRFQHQRVTWFHDVEQDRLEVLIHYGALYTDSATKAPGGGSPGQPAPGKEIREFLAGDEAVLYSWPMVFSPSEARASLEAMGEVFEQDLDSEQHLWRAFAELEVRWLGRFQDLEGEVGVVQAVTVPSVSRFLESVNRSIDTFVLSERRERSLADRYPGTLRVLQQAARAGHEWVGFRGQALEFRLPIHPGEWRVLRAKGLAFGADALIYSAWDDVENWEGHVRDLASMLAQAVSVEESDRFVVVRLGTEGRPGLLRLPVPREPPPHPDVVPAIRAAITAAIETDLDAVLAEALLAGTVAEDPDLTHLAEFGPPIAVARALVTVGRQATDAERDGRVMQALEQLAAFGQRWVENEGAPPPPAVDGLTERESLDAWDAWCRETWELLAPRR